MFILVKDLHFRSWVSTRWRLLECAWDPLSCTLHIMAKSHFLFCLCLFDEIVEIHAMDHAKILNESFIENKEWISLSRQSTFKSEI